MRFLVSIPLLVSILFSVSCKKDPPTLNEKIEGSWRVTFYEIYTTVWSVNNKNGIAFQREGANVGTIWWAEHRDFAGTKDTAIGSYILDETAGSVNIKWKDVPNPYGMTKDGTYNIILASDTLRLLYPDAHNLNVTVHAVRN